MRRAWMMAGVVLLASALPRAGWSIDWNVFHGDRRHSGYTPNDAPFDSLLAWSHDTGDSIVDSSPVLAADGTIYIGTVGEQLLAFSPLGDPLWAFNAAGNFRHSTPAVAADGTIYAGGSDGVLYAVNPNGSWRWSFPAGSPIKTSPNIAADGAVIFGASNGVLYALNPQGTLRWSYPTGGEIRSSPAIGPDGTIFFGSADHYFYALFPNGTLRWRALTGDIIKYCSPAVTEDGVVYFGSYDGFIYALTTTQQFLWAYPTGDNVRSSPAIGADSTIYIGSSTRLLALNPDGTEKWHYSTNGPVSSSPVYFADDDVVIVGSDDGAVYCVHASNGSLDWRYTVGSPVMTTPAPGLFGLVYAADARGRLWAFGNANPVAIGEGGVAASLPSFLALPNPTHGAVAFRSREPGAPLPSITIFDVAGRRVATLPSSSSGVAIWDGVGRDGASVTGGVYYFRVEQHQEVGRLVVTR